MIILLLPVKTRIVFDEGKLKAYINVLCFKIKLKKKGKASRKKSSSSKNEEVLFTDKIINMNQKLMAYYDIYVKTSKLTKKYFNVKKFVVNITVGTGDAALTAVSAGSLWGIVYNFIGALGNFLYIDNPDVTITPDYNETEFKSDAECIISTRIVYIIFIMISILIKHKKSQEE